MKFINGFVFKITESNFGDSAVKYYLFEQQFQPSVWFAEKVKKKLYQFSPRPISGQNFLFGFYLYSSKKKHCVANYRSKYFLHYSPIRRDASRYSDCAVPDVFLRSQPNR